MAIAVALGALWQFVPLADASARLGALPAAAPGIRSENMELTPAEQQIFARTNVVKRIASVDGQPVVLTVIDGTRNRHAIHDPRFCFQGAGWTVKNSDTVPVEHGEATRLKLEKSGETAEAVFWFTDGEHQFNSPYTYWMRTTLRRLTFGRSGGEPVLVILTTGGSPSADWDRLLHAWSDLQAL